MSSTPPRQAAEISPNASQNTSTNFPELPTARIAAAGKLGQQIWLDNLSRSLVSGGVDSPLAHWIVEQGISGLTSNPAIFFNAIKNDAAYQDDLAALRQTLPGDSPEALERRFEALVLPDIQAACDLFLPAYQATKGKIGYVSFEVAPRLAHDAAGTVAAAKRLWAEIDRPNLMIKIPATKAGLSAITDTIAAGINVNVTLIFSKKQLKAVQTAHRDGIQRRIGAGFPVENIASVASVFISRTDTALEKVEPRLPSGLQGQVAIALAKTMYVEWLEDNVDNDGPRQLLLWASTGTKNPKYSDTYYVDNLIGPFTVNTVPDATLAAFIDHGKVEAPPTLYRAHPWANTALEFLAGLGVDLDVLGEELQETGLKQFEEAFAKLLDLVA